MFYRLTMHPSYKAVLLATLLVPTLPSLSYAAPIDAAGTSESQTTADSNIPSATLSTISVTATKATVSSTEISALAKTTITQSDMIQFGDTSISDSLRRVAGIQIGGGGLRPGGRAAGAGFRGAGMPVFLINGEPIQGGGRGAADLIDTFTPEMIDRIEITKTPSVTQGSLATGAVINIILKEARHDGSIGGVAKLGYGYRSGARQYQRQSALLQVDGKQDKLGFNVSANYNASDTQTHNHLNRLNSSTQLFEDFNSRSRVDGYFVMLAPKLEYRLSDMTKASADLFYRTVKRDVTIMPDGEDNQTEQTDSTSVRLNTRIERKTETLLDRLRFSFESEKEAEDHSATTANPHIHEKTDQQSLSYDGMRTVSGTHQIKFGGTANSHSIRSNVTQTLDETRLALYGEENWRIAPKHTITAGTRYETLNREGLIHYDNDYFSPAVAYRYTLSDVWSMQTSFSQSYLIPNTNDLSPTISVSSDAHAGSITTPDRSGNPNLTAQKIRGHEAILGYNVASGGFNLTAYHRQIDDYIERIVELDSDSGRYVRRPVNQSEAITTGAELETRWAFKPINGHVLRLNWNVATTHAKIISEAGSRLANGVAPYTSNAGVSYQYSPWRLLITTNVNYTPKYGRLSNDRSYTTTKNATTAVDLSTTKRFTDGWGVSLNINNLLSSQSSITIHNSDGQLTQYSRDHESPSYMLNIEKRF